MLNVDDNDNNKKTPSDLSPKMLNFWVNNNLKDCSKTTIQYVTTRSKPKVESKKITKKSINKSKK